MAEPNYAESWVSQPDVCRCCLSTSGTWDVTSSYVTETGDKEVYSEMLLECYGITMSFLPVFGPSKMVCELCVRHIRDALNFRKQVENAEQQFIAYRNSMQRVFQPVVLRVEEPKPPTPVESSTDDDDSKTIDVLTLPKERPIVDRMYKKPRKPGGSRKRAVPIIESEEDDDDLDSDTPMSVISKKNHATPSVANGPLNSSDLDSVASAELPKKKRLKKRLPKDLREHTQNVKNNQDLRSNITLLLKHTTIMPFRYINNNQYQCQYCDKPYLLFKDLKKHVKLTHSGVTEKQIIRTIRDPRDLVKADVSDISCRLCGSTFNTIEKIIEHLKQLHDKTYVLVPGLKNAHCILGYDLSDGIKCYICHKEFPFIKTLSTHMNDHDADYICHICGKRFVQQHRLEAHVDRHRAPDLKCKFCSKVLRSVAAKRYHTRKEHTAPASYQCPECPQVFAQYNQRLKHMIAVHKFKKPENQCSYCSKHFAHSSALSTHIKQCHFKEDNKKHVCEICDKAFCEKWILERHLNVHTGGRNYVCQFCSKKFAKKFTLQIHEKLHFNDKDHKCILCGREFVHKHSLVRHMSQVHPNGPE